MIAIVICLRVVFACFNGLGFQIWWMIKVCLSSLHGVVYSEFVFPFSFSQRSENLVQSFQKFFLRNLDYSVSILRAHHWKRL